MARTEDAVGGKQETIQSTGGHALSPSLLFPWQISGRIVSFYNTSFINPLYSSSSDELGKNRSPENMSLVKI